MMAITMRCGGGGFEKPTKRQLRKHTTRRTPGRQEEANQPKKEKVAGCVDLLAPRDRTQTPAVMRMKGVMLDGEAGVEEREGSGKVG